MREYAEGEVPWESVTGESRDEGVDGMDKCVPSVEVAEDEDLAMVVWLSLWSVGLSEVLV